MGVRVSIYESLRKNRHLTHRNALLLLPLLPSSLLHTHTQLLRTAHFPIAIIKTDHNIKLINLMYQEHIGFFFPWGIKVLFFHSVSNFSGARLSARPCFLASVFTRGWQVDLRSKTIWMCKGQHWWIFLMFYTWAGKSSWHKIWVMLQRNPISTDEPVQANCF